MSIKAILFDLDGTLLPMDFDTFIKAYLGGLCATLAPKGYEPRAVAAALWKSTDAMIKNGWLYTGDMGRMDKDGFVYISGRKKNVIVLSNGKNVFPEEIETWINLCPAIKECVVYGEGDIIKAKIVTDENFEGDKKAEIDNHMKEVNEKFVYYKRVSEYTIQEEEMAKTSTGKIKRYVK